MNGKSNRSGRLWRDCTVVGTLLLGLSCQTQPHLVLDPVGPPSGGAADFAGVGSLRVYSGTQTRQVGNFINFYPHTPYSIYSTNGARLRWIENSVANIDEAPALVRLPAGLYTIRAQDDAYGRVTVPIVIKAGETTIVHLEARRLPSYDEPPASNAVRLPNGRIVGTRAAEPSGPKEK